MQERILKLRITDPWLVKQLEGFKDECQYKKLCVDEYFFDFLDEVPAIKQAAVVWEAYRIVLTPKPKPLPEPDWSKLGMLKSGHWLCYNVNSAWATCSLEPGIQMAHNCWSLRGDHCFLHSSIFDLSALPDVSPERWKECKWRVP